MNDNPKPGDVWRRNNEFRRVTKIFPAYLLYESFDVGSKGECTNEMWQRWSATAERVWPKPVASEPAAGTVRVRIAVGKEASGSWRYMASGCKKGAIPDEELIRDLNELDYDAVAFVEADVPSLHIPTIIAATVAAAGEKEEQSKQEQP